MSERELVDSVIDQNREWKKGEFWLVGILMEVNGIDLTPEFAETFDTSTVKLGGKISTEDKSWAHGLRPWTSNLAQLRSLSFLFTFFSGHYKFSLALLVLKMWPMDYLYSSHKKPCF